MANSSTSQEKATSPEEIGHFPLIFEKQKPKFKPGWKRMYRSQPRSLLLNLAQNSNDKKAPQKMTELKNQDLSKMSQVGDII